MAQINENVFNYFGTNAGILQNKYTEDEWNAYYEGKIEPFAIQLSLDVYKRQHIAAAWDIDAEEVFGRADE